jgi:peptidoglycan/LPS O-acetylase OafA/YrhL
MSIINSPPFSSPHIPDSIDEGNNDFRHSQDIAEDTSEFGHNPEWFSVTDQYLREKSLQFGGTLTSQGKDILIALLPSFIQHWTQSSITQPVLRKVQKTGWLDGLRGIASLIVMIHHSSWLWLPELSKGYGSCPDCYQFLQLPFVRLFFSGSPMVAIFFVISGFSLSHRALGLIKKERLAEVLESLSSSTFRRGIRLVLPPIVLTFFMMILSYHGLYVEDTGRTPPRFPSFSENFWNWFYQSLTIADIFRPVFYTGNWFAAYIPQYDPNLWTIDVEFHGSLVIFLTLLGVSKLRPLARVFVLTSIPLWLLYFAHSYLFLFISGVLLAELHHSREDRLFKTAQDLQTLESPPYIPTRPWPPLSTLTKRTPWTIFWIFNFILSLFVLSIPLIENGAANTPGYRTLVSLIPLQYLDDYIQDQFWIYLAAVNLIWTIDNAPFLQSVFMTGFARYMGKIGFALYLVHGTILYTFAYRLDLRGFWLLAVARVVCVWLMAFWLADLVWRGVDEKSVVLAKWLYGIISMKKEQSQS